MINQNQNQLNLEAKSSELYIDSGGSGDFCNSLIYEPSNISEIQIGSLYIAGEIKPAIKNCSYLINSLASVIKKELYRNPKRLTADSFEASLNKANAYLGDIASQGNIGWIGNINMACALFSQNQLHIAHTGNARILLLRNGRLTGITEDAGSNSENPFPSKTFVNIISGPAISGDRIILATSGLFNMLSLEELRHIASSESCTKAIENLGEISETDDEAETSSVIIVDLKKPLTARFSEETNQTSELDKNSTLEEYSAFSLESPLPLSKLSLMDILGESPCSLCSDTSISKPSSAKAFKLDSGRKIFKILKEAVLKNLFFAIKKTLKFTVKYSQKFIKTLLAYLKKSCIGIFNCAKFLKQRIKGSQLKNEIRVSSESEFARNLEILAGLPANSSIEENKIVIKIKKHQENSSDEGGAKNRRKLLISIARILKFSIPALIVAVGVFGTFFLSKKDAPAQPDIPAKVNSIVYQGYLQKARQNQQDAETALIYKDEKKARNLLSEASGLIEKSVKLGASSDDLSEIRNDINAQLDHIDKITTIQNPFLICDLNEFFSAFNASEINAENGTLQAIDTGNFKTADIDTVSYRAKNIAEISLPPYFAGTVDAGAYGGYNYFLDPAQNQIFKIVSGQPKAWIKESGIDLSAAVSMSIDGNIYVLNSNNSVYKLSSGKLRAAITIGYDLENPNKIYTRAEIDKIIVLDPPAKKIIITAKTGELLSQLKSDNFDDLKDVYIDPNSNSMYVLNGNKVYRIDL